MKYLPIFLLVIFTLSDQLYAQQYDIYFSNFETDLIQLSAPKQIDLGIGLGITGTGNINLQLGYSPIKHLSVSIGYFNQRGNDVNSNDFEIREARTAYTISVGTYYYLANEQRDVFEPGTKIVDLSKRRSLLLLAEVGLSANQMTNAGLNRGMNFYSAKLSYENIFLNLGIGYEHKYGMATATLGFKRLKYTKVTYTGINFDIDKLSAITQQLSSDATYNIFGVGIHNQFGKKIIKVQAGGTLPLVYFQEFKNQAAEIDNSSLYVGCVMDIQRLIKYFKGGK